MFVCATSFRWIKDLYKKNHQSIVDLLINILCTLLCHKAAQTRRQYSITMYILIFYDRLYTKNEYTDYWITPN